MIQRCPWVGEGKPFYEDYHDNEWGIPKHDDRDHLELLILEGMQAGLSWELILKKREAFRALFHNFDPEKVAAMCDGTLEEIAQNPAIIRNRRKIFSARDNARIFREIQKEFGSFDAYVWPFVGGKPIVNRWKTHTEVPCLSSESQTLSQDLKKRGMTFVGPTILYSYMQAAGLVSDHLITCFQSQEAQPLPG